MPLKFPNARLFLHELLAGQRLSGAQAIAQGACQFGLVSSDCALDLLPLPDDHQCQCLAAAKKVVKKHFEQRPEQSALPEVDHEEVWSAIEKHVKCLPQAAGIEPGEACQGQGAANICRKHAPALFDVMLQQLGRYP